MNPAEYKPGDSVTVEFCTQVFATGVATNADSTPVGTINKNGTDDGAVTVTVTNIDAGRYKAAFTIPATYVPGDVINLTIAATVSSVAGKACVWHRKVGMGVVQSGTATAGGAATITIQTALGANSRGVGCIVVLVAGTGAGQAGIVTNYVDSTKVVTVGRNWVTNPDSTTVYVILPCDAPKVDANLKVTGVVLVDAVTTVTNLTNAPGAGDFTATMKTSLNNATPAVTVSDKTGFSLSAAGVQAIWDALASALTAVGSVGKLIVTNLDAAISSRSTYAGGDTSGTTTLLSRITAAVALAGSAPSWWVVPGDATAANQATILARLGSFTGSGVNTVFGFFKSLLSKTASTPSDVGGTFDPATDSTEAIRDRGDAAWITATGFSTHTAADVWASATRTLSAGTNIVLVKGTGVTGLNDLSAAQVNAEADTALADVGLTPTITGRIDAAMTSRMAAYTQPAGFLVATFPADLAGLAGLASAHGAGSWATATGFAVAGDAMTLTTGERNAVADAKFDRADGVEAGLTERQAYRLLVSVLGSLLSGAGTATETFRDFGDTKDRVVATVDANGNRTAVTRDLT